MVHYSKVEKYGEDIKLPGAHGICYTSEDKLYISKVIENESESGGIVVCEGENNSTEDYINEKCSYYSIAAASDDAIAVRNGTMETIELYSNAKTKVCEWELPTGIHKGLTVNKDGNVLVCDFMANCIREYKPNGELEQVIQSDCIRKPSYIAACDNGYVVTCMGSGAGVIKIDRKGKEIWSYDELDYPQGVAIDKNGDVYVCDADPDQKKVVMITSDGEQMFTIANSKQLNDWAPFAVAVCGNKMAVHFRDNTVVRQFKLV